MFRDIDNFLKIVWLWKNIRYLIDIEKKMFLVLLFIKNIFLNINLNNCFDIYCCLYI